MPIFQNEYTEDCGSQAASGCEGLDFNLSDNALRLMPTTFSNIEPTKRMITNEAYGI